MFNRVTLMNRPRAIAWLLLVTLLFATGCKKRNQVREFRPPPPPKSQTEKDDDEATKSDETKVVSVQELNAQAEAKKIEPPPKLGKIEPKIIARIATPGPDNPKDDARTAVLEESYLNRDGSVLITKSDKAVRSYEIPSGKLLFEFKNLDRSQVRYYLSPNGNCIAKIDLNNNTAEVFDSKTQEPLAVLKYKGETMDSLGSVIAQYSPDGKRFLFVNRNRFAQDNRFYAVQELDCTTGTSRRVTLQETPSANGADNVEALIPLNQPDQLIIVRREIVAGGSVKQHFQLCTPAEKELKPVNWLYEDGGHLSPSQPLSHSLAFSNDRRLMVSRRDGQKDGSFAMVPLSTREIAYKFTIKMYEVLSCPVFTPDSQRLLLIRGWDRSFRRMNNSGTVTPFGKDTLELINVRNGKLISSFDHDNLGWKTDYALAKHVSISGDGKRIALTRGSTPAEVVILDFESCFGLAPLATPSP